MLRGCVISVEYGNLYAYSLFYNAFVFSYSVSLPFFYVLSFVMFVFFCNDHLIGVSRWKCRCSGIPCGWGAISLSGRARLNPVRYSYRGLSQDSIQEELEDEPLQFKGTMTRARSKRLKDQNYSKLLMLQAIWNSKNMKIMARSTFEI